MNIIAIGNESGTTIEILPEYRLQKGDVIVVIGKVEDIDAFEEAFGE